MSKQYGQITKRHYYVAVTDATDHSNPSLRGSLAWAINQLPEDGGVIELGVGTYEFITENITPAYLIRIQNKSNIMIKGVPNSTIIYTDQVTNRSRRSYFLIEACPNFTIQDLCFRGEQSSDDTSRPATLLIKNSMNVTINNVWFGYENKATYPYMNLPAISHRSIDAEDQSHGIRITNCYFYHNRIYANDALINIKNSTNYNISNNKVKYLSGTALLKNGRFVEITAGYGSEDHGIISNNECLEMLTYSAVNERRNVIQTNEHSRFLIIAENTIKNTDFDQDFFEITPASNTNGAIYVNGRYHIVSGNILDHIPNQNAIYINHVQNVIIDNMIHEVTGWGIRGAGGRCCYNSYFSSEEDATHHGEYDLTDPQFYKAIT